ncbi:hypothetical protein AeNC1_012312 [Aphanomyces euteiches]|nr:hypothetical protein AeNC1_012312 [Aphanomyces euteiches]
MERLGFSTDGLLMSALKEKPVWDLPSEPHAPSNDAWASVTRLEGSVEDDAMDDLNDGMQCATPDLSGSLDKNGDTMRLARRAAVETILLDKVHNAEIHDGLTNQDAGRLREMLFRYADVFREDVEGDPPVKVEPLKVRLKPGSVPVKCSIRWYPPAHMDFLKRHFEQLERASLVYKNNRATWASARIVPNKDPGDLRMTIDNRPINACTEPMPWPMPNLDSTMTILVGTAVYFTLDWTKGYWQLPLHPDSQMYYSFMTPWGVYTPTRVLMGQTDAVAYCQSVVH